MTPERLAVLKEFNSNWGPLTPAPGIVSELVAEIERLRAGLESLKWGARINLSVAEVDARIDAILEDKNEPA